MIAGIWRARASAWGAVLLVAIGIFAVVRWVDLAPKVETDFFFSADDPQLQESLRLEERYPGPDRVIVRAGGDQESEAYTEAVAALAEALAGMDEVLTVRSRATEDPEDSPLWSRVVGVPEGGASNLILEIPDDTDLTLFVPRLDTILETHRSAELDLAASGTPVIVERIRQDLFRDLIVFSIASLTLFGLMLGVIYRNAWTVLGALATCLGACTVTLLMVRAVGVSIGLLTANIITIVFVLTLSHVVFITGSWVREGAGRSAEAAVRATIEPSTWAMLTTLLGFLSLLAASAKPLRDLGLSGAIGTVTAIACAYLLYPAFLSRRDGEEATAGADQAIRLTPEPGGGAWATGSGRWFLPNVGLVVLVLGLGVLHLDTDPGLLTYFDPDGGIRAGLEAIDQEGGSSPLEVAIRDPDGPLDSGGAYERMWALQDSLEADPDVGVVLSPAVIIAEAKSQPLAGLLTHGLLLDIAGATAFQSSIRSFIYEDRSEGRYSLRMREGERSGSRAAVIAGVRADVEAAGLEVTGLGGLYELQRVLGGLIARSILLGLGGLILLFVGIAYLASRGGPETLAMVACLIAIPLVVLGVFGHLGVAVDIITSPAANLSLAMGVDSMIHLVVRWRRLGGLTGAPGAAGPDADRETAHGETADAWTRARADLTRPILAVSGMICLGFGIFALSAFPPTRRFGFAVILGTATAAYLALVVLPRAADRLRPDPA